jgi:hypothetical protein
MESGRTVITAVIIVIIAIAEALLLMSGQTQG